MKKEGIRAILFDMDGTLLDSMAVWEGLGKAFLLEQGNSIPGDIDKSLAPLSFEEGAGYFRREFGVEQSVEAIVARMYQMASENYDRMASVKPFVPEYLSQCQKEGLVLGVATVTDFHLADRVLRRFGLRHFFQEVFTCDQLGKRKSEPAFFYAAAEALALEPEEIAVFEDSYYSASTALHCGCRVIGVYDAFSSRDEQKLRACSHRYIKSFQELLND